MKILHVIAPAPAGGAESVVHMLTSGQRAAGHDARIAAILPPAGGHPFVEQAQRLELPITEIRLHPRRYLAQADAVAALIREAGTELVNTHVYHADVVGYLAAKRTGTPFVATLHGFTSGGAKHAVYSWLDMRVMKRAGAVICVAEQVRQRAVERGTPPERAHVVRNGFAPGPIIGREPARSLLGVGRGQCVGWVGRLAVEKGADLMLEAATRLPETVETILIGDGPERPALDQKAEALGSRAHFAGALAGAASMLSAFDVVAISSRSEGTPVVLLEAMAAGVPVVAFAVGGIPQVVDESSAWLVPPGNTEAFAAALRQALADPAEAARRAAKARMVLASKFSLDDWVKRTDEVYRVAAAKQDA